MMEGPSTHEPRGPQPEAVNADQSEERSPQAEVMENLLSVMTGDAQKAFGAVASAQTYDEWLARIDAFNALGKAQLDRADSEITNQLENESLASRQIEFTLDQPMGRTLKVSRDMHGVVTLSDGLSA